MSERESRFSVIPKISIRPNKVVFYNQFVKNKYDDSVSSSTLAPAVKKTLQEMGVPVKSLPECNKHNFEISLSFITILSKRLQYLLRLVESISLKDVAARLCEYLISEIKKKKNKIENGDVITIKIKNYALADYLGTIPETLSRISKKLEEKNIIKKEKNKIIILNKEQFIKIAKGKIKEI